tara:strand:+ start:802 stop:2211 length:1410 start_codon:yes stop_codon:yes gene_type:complete
MITPNIAPTRVLNPLSKGLFTAAKNSVSRTKELTSNISKANETVKKNEKFAMNFIEFFGSKKTAKILKKSLESIKKSLVATLEIAKLLRTSLNDLVKAGKKSGRGGLFGGIGGLIGGAIAAFFGKAALITLGILAVGGLGALLVANREAVFNFLNTNRKRLEGIVKPIIDAQLKNMFRSPEVKAIENEAFSRVDNKMKSLTPREGETQDELYERAKQEVIKDLDALMDREDQTQAQKNRANLMKQALTSKEEFQGFLREDNTFQLGSTQLGKALTTDAGFEGSAAGYMNRSDKAKLNLMKREVELNDNNLQQLKSRVEGVLDRNPNEDERGFAMDLLNYIQTLRSGDQELIKNFNEGKGVIPSSQFEGAPNNLVPNKNKISEMFKAKPLVNGKSLDKSVKNESGGEFSFTDFNSDNLPKYDIDFNKGDVIPQDSGSGINSGESQFIATKPNDRLTLSAMLYGIALSGIA